MNADEHSGDNSRRHRRPFVPHEDWIDAFDAQCDERMLRRLHRFALAWARILGGESVGNDAYYAEELVQNALTDIIAGVLRWDPSTHALEPYLMDVIRLRARRDRKRGVRHGYVPSGAAALDDPRSSIEHVEASLAADAAPEVLESAETAEATMTRTMTTLRRLAADDSLAQRFLDAIENDAGTRAEIKRTAGLTSAEYHNTRRRLARLITQLESSSDLSAKED
jgi:hypothetical protein